MVDWCIPEQKRNPPGTVVDRVKFSIKRDNDFTVFNFLAKLIQKINREFSRIPQYSMNAEQGF